MNKSREREKKKKKKDLHERPLSEGMQQGRIQEKISWEVGAEEEDKNFIK